MKIYNKNFSPVEKEENFVWIAEYNKEDIHKRNYLPEFEFKDGGFGHLRHTFDEIDKAILTNLGYMGRGYSFYFNTENGLFNLFGSELEVSYYDIDNQIEYKFMNKKDISYNDIIIFKTVVDEIDVQKNTQKKFSLEYAVGYKAKIDDFNIKSIFYLSMKKNTSPYLKFKITSPRNIHGELRLYLNNKLGTVIKSDLNANLGKTFKVDIN